MLDESSYLTALWAYLGSASLALILFAWWLRRSLSAGWITLLTLLGAALLLTPAFPRSGVDTMAPALVVAAFQFFTAGVEEAGHALRPLAASSGLAVVLALLLRFTLFRRRPDSSPVD